MSARTNVQLESMKCLEPFFCWLLAFSLSWTNLTNGWMWITYASVSDYTSQYYQVTLGQVNWISLLYAVIMTLGSLPFLWLIDHFGVKVSVVVSSVFNLVCAILHCFSSFSFVPVYWRYPILITGSIFGGLAQPLCLFSSTKLASSWFSAEDRISANTLAAMGNPLGVLLSNLFSPRIVRNSKDIPFLNLLNLIPASVGIVLVLLSVLGAPNRHSVTANHETVSFSDQLKLCFRNVNFWILEVCFAVLLGIFTTISTLIQQMLCPLGYSDVFSGVCGALFLAMGIPGVLVVGPIVTRTNALKEVVKWGVLLTTFGMIAFSIASTAPDHHLMIALSVSVMGLFGFGVYPSALELAAETAYPAGEVMSTGLLLTLSQFFSIFFIIVSQVIVVPVPRSPGLTVCSKMEVKSYWVSNTVLSVIAVVNATVLLFVFNTEYKRVESEKKWMPTSGSYLPLVDGDQETSS